MEFLLVYIGQYFLHGRYIGILHSLRGTAPHGTTWRLLVQKMCYGHSRSLTQVHKHVSMRADE
jgi:hypothetical protein